MSKATEAAEARALAAEAKALGVRYHSEPLLSAICAHFGESPFTIFWLGDGANTCYVGRCMSLPTDTRLMGKCRYRELEYITTAADFKRGTVAFAREAAEAEAREAAEREAG